MGAKIPRTKPPSSFDSIEEDWPWVWGMRDPECLDWKQGLSDDEIQSEALRQQNLPVAITDTLYLGNAASVESIRALEENGITAVLNMAGPLALKRKTIGLYKTKGITYGRITAMDEPDYPLLHRHWQEALDFIKASTEKPNGKCVVHCVAGMNRSGLIVAAYYMLTTKTSVLEAVKHIRKQRGNVALCNEGFQQQLVSMARQNSLLGPRPGTKESIVKQVPAPFENDWMFAASAKRTENPLDRLL